MTLVPDLQTTQARRLLTNSVKMQRAKTNTALTMGETFVRVRSLDQRVDNLIASANYTETVLTALAEANESDEQQKLAAGQTPMMRANGAQPSFGSPSKF